MAKYSIRVRIVACAAGLAQCVSLPVSAAEKTAKPAIPLSSAAPASTKPSLGADIALVDGTLSGKLLSSNGQPIDGAVITVLKDGKEIGKAVTTSDGSYSISDLKTGAHTIQTANGQQQVRLWAKEVAPASAKSQLTLSQTAIRGQGPDGGFPDGGGEGGAPGGGSPGGGFGGGGFGGGGLGGFGGGLGGGLGGLGGASMSSLLLGGVAVGAASFGAVQMNQNQKLQNEVNQLQDQVDQLQSP